MKRSIVISGVKHSGKTTLGQMLAARLNSAWYDLDQLIMNRPENSQWPGVRELFREMGQQYFQQQETQAASDFLKRFNPGTQYAVLSLGGGTVENESAMEIIREKGLILYFAVPEEVLYKRIMKGGIPPFLSPEHPQEDFHKLYLKRDGLNRDLAHGVIELSDVSKEENLEKIWDVLLTFRCKESKE